MDIDVIVVGAGLAGLRTALELQSSGHSVVVLEADQRVGGRVRTDHVDGFLLDRGFQVLNPGYGEVRAVLDLPLLRLQPFGRGIAVRDKAGLTVLADPVHYPQWIAGAVTSPYLRPAQMAKLLRWVGGSQSRAADESLAQSLDRAGISGPLRALLDAFLSGVLADTHGETSAAFTRSLVGWFLRGTPALPAEGMRAVPAQLAQGLDVRLGQRVRSITGSRGAISVHAGGSTLTARAVVLAIDPVDLGILTHRPTAPMRGFDTWWFAADEQPTELPFIVVDAERVGPVVTSVVVSNIARSYAPVGRHLIACSVVRDGNAVSEQDVRTHARHLYGTPTDHWQVVAHHEIPRSLPVIPPGMKRPDIDLGGGLFVAGDHVEGASIQGALLSGLRAARAVHGFLTR